MESREVISIINEIEERFPVHKWRINSFDIWPYIRFRLGSRLFSQRTGKSSKISQIYNKYIRHFFLFLKAFGGKSSIKNLVNEYDYIFLENGVDSTFLNDNFYYFRTDPIREKIERTNKKCATFVGGYRFLNPTYLSATYFQYAVDLFIIKNRIIKFFRKAKETKSELEEYENFLLYLRDKKICEKEFEPEEIFRATDLINLYKKYFKNKLTRFQPKAVFILCYYSTYGFGMISACKELRIPVVDIQHGIQGDYHYAYGNFMKIPNNGFNSLPDIFYVWGGEEARAINKWNRGAEVFVGGNDFLEMWRNDSSKFPQEAKTTLSKRYSLSKFSKVVLFTVYPGSNHDDLIIKAIKNSPADWMWFVRHHPKSNERSEKIRERIGNVKCGLEINGITSIPLFALLKVSDVHITERSSTIIESSYLGIPSIVTTKECQELFKTQFDQKMVSLKENVEDIVNEIAQSEKRTPILKEKKENIEKLLEMIEQRYAHHN